MPTRLQLARMIDHALLRPDLTTAQVIAGCELAQRLALGAVCVRPCDVSLAARALAQSAVCVTTVVGFPHGHEESTLKAEAAELAMRQGARELDMVINIGRLVSRDFAYVEQDIRAVTTPAHARGVIVKVILETCLLDEELMIEACRISERAGADFVKTSTGFAASGATRDDVALMRRSVSAKVQVKASGGIRDLAAVMDLYAAGATRLGTSAFEAILNELAAGASDPNPIE